MKTTKSLIGLALCALATTSAFAQATTNPPAATKNQLIEDAKQIGHDGWAALKDLSFKEGFTIAPFALTHKGDWGGGVAVETASTNALNFGFAIAAIHNGATRRTDFYDATLSVSLQQPFTIPLIKKQAYAYVETGPGANLNKPTEPLIQSIAGVKMIFPIGSKWLIAGGGGVGHNSEWIEDVFYIGHVSITRKF